jgi:hypothetical protein
VRLCDALGWSRGHAPAGTKADRDVLQPAPALTASAEDASAYANDVCARVRLFVDDDPGGLARWVQSVQVEGDGATTKILVTFAPTQRRDPHRWMIWDETNPFNEPWCPPSEVSSEIGIAIAEMLRSATP